ncbi:hypothetical protein [Adlercreutzia sp. ZJ138]|nr:hypothetical protein [Adlercreutzia sp. ZJ138]
MVKRKRDIRQFIYDVLGGMGVIVLALSCFIVFLWVCIIVVRLVMG